MHEGWAVLRPTGVSFFPEDSGAKVLEWVTGAPAPHGVRVEVPWLVEVLLVAVCGGLRRAAARAAALTEGLHWPAAEAERDARFPVWKDIHLTRGEDFLCGKVTWTQEEAAERALAAWCAARR